MQPHRSGPDPVTSESSLAGAAAGATALGLVVLAVYALLPAIGRILARLQDVPWSIVPTTEFGS